MTERKTRPRGAPAQVSAPEEICPHLGIEEDLQTCLAYPSGWNLCHRCHPASVVRLGYQRKTCLSPAHKSCLVFQGEQAIPLPAELRGQRRIAKKVPLKKFENP